MNRLLTIVDTKYQRLEYLESTGTQYIDTGVYLTGDSRIKCKAQSSYPETGFRLFGSEYENEVFRFGTSKVSDTIFRWYSGYYNSYLANQNVNYDQTVFEVDFNKNNVYINNELVNSHTYHEFTATHTAYLFTINTNSIVVRPSKIYYCQIYANGVLVRNFVPVLRKSDNEIGMLDLVEGKFYGNAGTGKFTANLDTMYALIQGSPTVQDGRVSGFSADNYLKLQEPIKPTGAFEIKLKFNTTDLSKVNGLFHSLQKLQVDSGRFGIMLTTYYDGTINLCVSTNGTSWLFDQLSPQNIIQINVNYYVKFGWTGTEYYVDLSTNDTNYSRVITYNSTEAPTQAIQYSLIGIYSNGPAYLNGTIDLNRSYIKIDDTKYKLQAVVGYTIVGSPTITDGVVSGFSVSDYLEIQKNITPVFFEANIRFTYQEATSVNQLFFLFNSSSAWSKSIHLDNQTNRFRLFYGDNRYLQMYSFVPIANHIYNFNITYYNGTLVCTGEDMTSSIKRIYAVENISIQLQNAFNYTRIGTQCVASLDLNNTYIKINNKLWFNGQQA